MRQSKKIGCALLALGMGSFMLLVSESSVTGQGPVTIETIHKAWRARQERAKTLRFVWTERKTVLKGQVTREYTSRPLGKNKLKQMGVLPGEELPPADTAYEVPCTLVLEGVKMRYEREDRLWSFAKREFAPWPRTVVFDGNTGKKFFPVISPSNPRPQGYVAATNLETRPVALIPLALTFRPFDEQLCSVIYPSMKLTGRRSLIKGNSCLELEYRERDSIWRAFVDPTQDYLVMRIVDVVNDKMTGSIDISYRRDANTNWIPIGWSITNYDLKGGLRSSRQAKVNTYELNQSIDGKEFQVEFPPGTLVHSKKDEPKMYIAKEGDRKRPILREEHGVPFGTLLNTEPGEAVGMRRRWFLSWPVGLAIVALIVAGGVLVWRVRTVGKSQA